MTLARQRQLARLEKLAEPHIERIRQAKAHHYAKTAEKVFNSSLVHAANLSLIILYGKPQIDEPLSKAWQRCCESTSPELDAIKEIRGNNIFNPFGDRLVGQAIAERFRSFVLPHHPGANEQEKFNKILASAPLWLIWFTWADVTIGGLQLSIPDFSTIEDYERSLEDLGRLPALPTGQFANVRWSNYNRQKYEQYLRDYSEISDHDREVLRGINSCIKNWQRGSS